MSVRVVLSLCVLLSCVCTGVLGHADGAPISTCTSMIPGHGEDQDGDSFTLDVGSVTNYTAGREVRVTVSGPNFQGIIIQARNEEGDIIGTFQDPGSDSNLKLLACGDVEGSAITHSSAAEKNNPELVWIPPATASGNVNFIATVATTPFVWWSEVTSGSLEPDYTDGIVTLPATNPDTDPSNPQATTEDPTNGTPTLRGVAGVLVVMALVGNLWNIIL